jgi:DNA-binding MarR family transcriptional regulator
MDLNEIIHQPIRLKIMSALCTLPAGEHVDFTVLRAHLGVTDGNLGAHLRKLGTAQYVEISKTFVDRKPRTRVRVSDAGRRAFLEHVLALQDVIRGPSDLPQSSS